MANFAADSLSSNELSNDTSETSGGKFAIRSRILASLDAEFSKSNNALINSSGSGGSPVMFKKKKNKNQLSYKIKLNNDKLSTSWCFWT